MGDSLLRDIFQFLSGSILAPNPILLLPNLFCISSSESISLLLDSILFMSVNASEHLVGTLALYDVVEWFKRGADYRASWEYLVKQIMNRKVVTVHPEQPIQDLAPYFVEKSFNYIPVVEAEQLIGIISRADMIAAMQQEILHLRQKP